MSTAEEKPLAPVPVKTEPKEEIVIETKAEQTPAQSTGMSSRFIAVACGVSG